MKNKITFKIFISIMFILFIYSFCYGQLYNWDNLNQAFKEYIINPSHDNSMKVYILIPDKIIGENYPKGKNNEEIWESASNLEKLILNENRDAVRIGFKLFIIADGEYAEFLDWTIGKLINKNPKLFLQELKNHRKLTNHLGGLVGNYGPDFVDNNELTLSETIKRIKSLKGINDIDLKEVKDECLKELEDFQKTLNEIIKNK